MNIIWTKHSEERQHQWQQKRPDIIREAVETGLSYPEQIVSENDGFVVQSKFGKGLLYRAFHSTFKPRIQVILAIER